MDGGPGGRARFCGLHTIVEFERLLGFGAGARAMLRAIERCQGAGRCASPFACMERAGANGDAEAKLASLPVAAPASTCAAPRRSASIIQLRAATPDQLVSDQDGNVIERRIVHTDVVRDRGDNIAELLSYWTALKGGDRVPSFADIDPVRLAQLGLLGRLHVLNAENPDPLLMRFDLYGN